MSIICFVRLADGPALPVPTHRFSLVAIPPARTNILMVGGTISGNNVFTDRVYELDGTNLPGGWTERTDMTLWAPVSGLIVIPYFE